MLTKQEKAKRSTIAPKGLYEKDSYYRMGDKYIKVLTITALPDEYYECFLSRYTNNPNFYIDVLIEPSTLNLNAVLTKELKQVQTQKRETRDKLVIASLELKEQNLEEYIRSIPASSSRTLNVTINMYIVADTLEKLKEYEQEAKIEITNAKMRASAILYNQVDIMKKSSPLFINNDLSKNTSFLLGQPLPSLSVAGLYPFIFDQVNDEHGILIGTEAYTGGKIVFDQFFFKNNPSEANRQRRTAGNMIIAGITGMGKTTLMNLLIFGHVINRNKVIWLDPENKNASLTRKLGGNYIQFGLQDQLINIFDLKPISTDDETNYENDIYNTNLAIANVVEDITITFKMLFETISDEEISMINEITVRSYEAVGIDGRESFQYFTPEAYPTFSNFASVIDEMIEEQQSNELVLFALQRLQMKMKRIVGTANVQGQWSRYFNGKTNIDMSSLNTASIVSFGTKDLFGKSEGLRNALLRLVFNYSWANCLGTTDRSVLVMDEDHNYILVPELAEIKAQFARRARKYNACTISGTQQVKDYADPSIKQHGQAIFDNSTYKFFFNLSRDGVQDLSELMTLTDGEKQQIESFPPYCGMFEIGNKKLPVSVLITDEEKSIIDDV